MTPEQIENLVAKLRTSIGDLDCANSYEFAMHQAADELEAQARRIKEIEAELAAPAPNQYLKEIYAFLESIAPEGIAAEAFRNVPDSVFPHSIRDRLSGSGTSTGENARPVSGHAEQAGSVAAANGQLVGTELAALKAQEPVTWGVDWGKHGDKTCVSIVKKHQDGTVEVVAAEYEPATGAAPVPAQPVNAETLNAVMCWFAEWELTLPQDARDDFNRQFDTRRGSS